MGVAEGTIVGVGQEGGSPVMVRVNAGQAPAEPVVTELTTTTKSRRAGTMKEKSLGAVGLAPISAR